MGNRLYGPERYAERLFDWNADRFPIGAWLEFERQDGDLVITLYSFDSIMAEATIENIDNWNKKVAKSLIKFSLRQMARYCDSVADLN